MMTEPSLVEVIDRKSERITNRDTEKGMTCIFMLLIEVATGAACRVRETPVYEASVIAWKIKSFILWYA